MQAIVLAGQPPAHPLVLEETRQTLMDAARRRFGELPGERIVDHVLRFTTGADFAVREAAVDALHRRWGFAERDGLVVATRPASGVLGVYTTKRKKDRREPEGRSKPPAKARRNRVHERRPYATELSSIEPIGVSCDCPDFVRSSLGLCKHALVVLADIFGSPRRLAAARAEHARTFGNANTRMPRLDWDPELPLHGALDRLEGLRLDRMPGKAFSSGSRAGKDAAKHWGRVRRGVAGGVIESVRLDPGKRRDLLLSLETLSGGAAGPRFQLDASPAARAIVREELERVERRLAYAVAVRPALEALSTLKRRLYAYQREGVEKFFTCGRLLLADDMGLGKTTQAIAACHGLFATGKARRGLVIVPASLKDQWLREWLDTTDAPATIVDGTAEERAVQYRRLASGFLILNYEQLLRDADHIQALRADIVVLDEAQRIKNYATKSAIYVKALTPEYRLVLTGTPMENRLEELASILDWVDDVALSPKWRLVPWHTHSDGDGGKEKGGARHLDGLRARLAPCVVRRVRREVLAQLPARTDTRVPVEMTVQQAAEHEELATPIARLVQASKRRPLTQPEFLRLMQLLTQQRIIANGLGQLRFEDVWPSYSRARPDATLLEGLFAPKLGELRRLLADLVIAQGRKVVVFSQWRRMLRLAEWSVRDVLGDRGIRSVFFTGAEKRSQRTKSVVEFHDDSRVSVMFLSDAGGVGLNLQKAATACINLELPWNPAVLEQRIGRIYRLGQQYPIDVYNLVTEASIEGRIAELLGAKQALFAGLFDGTSDAISFDTAASFMTRVERLVDPGLLPLPPAAADDRDTEAEGMPLALPEETRETDSALADELPPERAAEADMIATEATAPAVKTATGSANEARGEDARARTPASGVWRDPVAALFDILRVERMDDGGIRVEAPPDAASSLVALFQGMARLLGG